MAKKAPVKVCEFHGEYFADDPEAECPSCQDGKGFYVTKIVIEVLSEGPFEWDDIEDVRRATLMGDCSGISYTASERRLRTIEGLEKECRRHDTDPEFFLGEEYDTADAG